MPIVFSYYHTSTTGRLLIDVEETTLLSSVSTEILDEDSFLMVADPLSPIYRTLASVDDILGSSIEDRRVEESMDTLRKESMEGLLEDSREGRRDLT